MCLTVAMEREGDRAILTWLPERCTHCTVTIFSLVVLLILTPTHQAKRLHLHGRVVEQCAFMLLMNKPCCTWLSKPCSTLHGDVSHSLSVGPWCYWASECRLSSQECSLLLLWLSWSLHLVLLGTELLDPVQNGGQTQFQRTKQRDVGDKGGGVGLART